MSIVRIGECGGHWTVASSNSVEDEAQLCKTLSLYSRHYRVNLSDQLVIELNCTNQQTCKDHNRELYFCSQSSSEHLLFVIPDNNELLFVSCALSESISTL